MKSLAAVAHSRELEQRLPLQEELGSKLQSHLAASVHQQLTTANIAAVLDQEHDQITQLEEMMQCPLDRDGILTVKFSTLLRQAMEQYAPTLSGLVFSLGTLHLH